MNPVSLPETLAARLHDGAERYVVTGATGWLGRSCIDLLSQAVGVERLVGYASSASFVETKGGDQVPVRPLGELIELHPGPPTALIHAAYLTRGHLHRLGATNYVTANRGITQVVIEAIDRLRPLGVLHPSSGAAVWLPNTVYGHLKQEDERAFADACQAATTPLATVRIYAMSGPRMSQRSSYALGDLISQAVTGGDVVVRAAGRVIRSYVPAEQVCAVGLAMVLNGITAVRETGGQEIEIGELADLVLDVLGSPGSRVLRGFDPGAPEDRYVADPAGWRAMLAFTELPEVNMSDQVTWTATGWPDRASPQAG